MQPVRAGTVSVSRLGLGLGSDCVCRGRGWARYVEVGSAKRAEDRKRRVGFVRWGVPLTLCTELRDELGLRNAVETGTYEGESAVALRGLFKHVWTIEVDQARYDAARARHAGADVDFLLGSSDVVLPRLLRDLEEPALFWLDGHWMEDQPVQSAPACPVLPEIAAIDAWAHGSRSAVLVDDVRLFAASLGPPRFPFAWPTLMEVLDRLRANGDRYVTIIDDVIIAVPPDARSLLERYWWESQQPADAPADPDPHSPAPEQPPPPAATLTGARRAAAWARAAWQDLPPNETLRRARRHLLPPR